MGCWREKETEECFCSLNHDLVVCVCVCEHAACVHRAYKHCTIIQVKAAVYSATLLMVFISVSVWSMFTPLACTEMEECVCVCVSACLGAVPSYLTLLTLSCFSLITICSASLCLCTETHTLLHPLVWTHTNTYTQTEKLEQHRLRSDLSQPPRWCLLQRQRVV